jgi:LmeA-like phospholipid-binding
VRRLALVLIILLVVVALALVFGDRAARAFAESQVAAGMKKSAGFHESPDVSIKGGPFLPQVLAGRLTEVHVVGKELTNPVDGSTVSHMDVTLRGVRGHGASLLNAKSLDVDIFDGNALLSYADVANGARAAGQPPFTMAPANGNNQVRIETFVDPSKGLGSLGELLDVPKQVKVTALGNMSLLSGNRIQVRLTSIKAQGFPDQVTDAFASSAGLKNFVVPAAGLPKGVTLSNLQVTPEGLEVVFTGQNVLLGETPSDTAPDGTSSPAAALRTAFSSADSPRIEAAGPRPSTADRQAA